VPERAVEERRVAEERADVGVIGGSGLARLAGQHELTELTVETPFGDPSGPVQLGPVAGRRVAFLARHGVGHRLLPSEVNYRANIWALKTLGVERVVSLSACGSLKGRLEPRHFVLVDQFVDRTRGRSDTFFGDGLVAHVSMAEPTCADLRSIASSAAVDAGVTAHVGGTYLCMEGPQFGTRAESLLYRAWGADVVGMTNATEAKLAREAELCYVSVAMVTDYDCWKDDEHVTVDALLATLRANAEAGERLLVALLARLPAERPCSCGHALDAALITDPRAVPKATRERLALLLGPRCRP
jgi:5'-methylthioadenosine phosphorylase